MGIKSAVIQITFYSFFAERKCVEHESYYGWAVKCNCQRCGSADDKEMAIMSHI